MNCCADCFSSRYLNNVINSKSSKGDCDFCKSVNVSTCSPQELIPFFRNILNLYEVAEEGGVDLISALKVDFGDTIFSNKIENKSSLLKAIFDEEIDEFNVLFENNIKSILREGTHSEQSKEIHSTWEKFKEEIKNINRFHIKNTIDLNKLKIFFENESFLTIVKSGSIYYRSRISNKSGFDKEDMGPPKDKIAAGRANPIGISYLYLADNLVTSLYEVRAALFDFVTVGDFRLKDDLKILNLREPIDDPISWAEQEAIHDYLIYIPFIKTLQKELSLPIRRLDKEIDYLPTQYLSEFIKSIDYDGVEFQSSLYSEGYNLAIFNPDKFECIKVEICEIKEIDLKHERVY